MVGQTSGTSGEPKTYVRRRHSWARSLELSHTLFGVGEYTSTLAPGPVAHGLSLYALAESLYAGTAFHSMARYNSSGLIDMLHGGIERLVAVPTMLRDVCRILSQAHQQIASLRQIVLAGAALDRQLAGQIEACFPQAELLQYYGASETGFVSVARYDRPFADDLEAKGAGKPFPTVRLRLAPTHAAGPGQGVIEVSSDLVIDGYLENRKIHPPGASGWVLTHDLGSLDGDGNLFVLGRCDQMAVVGGYNISPEEIASVLRRLSQCSDCAVIAVADERLGQHLVAICESQEPQALEGAFGRHCSAYLPDYKWPRQTFVVGELARTPNGKIALGELQRMISEKDPALVPIYPFR